MNAEDDGQEPGMSEDWGGCWMWIFPGVFGVVIWVFAILGMTTCFGGG